MSLCIEQNDLVPWTLVLIGALTHTVKKYIIDYQTAAKQTSKSATAENADAEDQTKSQQPDTAGQTSTQNALSDVNPSPHTSEGGTQKPWLKWLQYTLIAWEYVSVTTVFVLDILTFVRVFPDQTGWINYQCLVLIALNSPNFKKGMLWFALTMASGEIKENSTADGKAAEEEQTADVKDSESDEDIADLCSVASVPFFFSYMVYGTTTIVHWFPGVMLYIWVSVLILLSLAIVGLVIAGVYYLFGKKMSDEMMEKGYQYLNQMTVIFSGIILGVTVIRFYDGQHYISSLVDTFEERSFKNYLAFQTVEFKNIMQFVSWVF